jgi:hypothetical protein
MDDPSGRTDEADRQAGVSFVGFQMRSRSRADPGGIRPSYRGRAADPEQELPAAGNSTQTPVRRPSGRAAASP